MAVNMDILASLIRRNHKKDIKLALEIQNNLVDAAGGESDYLIADLVRVIDYYSGELSKVEGLQDKIKELQTELNKAAAKYGYYKQQVANLEQQLKEAEQHENREKQLTLQIYNLQNENLQLRKSLDLVNGHYRQRAEVQSGKKIAYKDSADLKAILEMCQAGMDKKEMAEKLGVSLGTIYNRIKELKVLGML